MTATAYAPTARQLPVWLAMSLVIHAVALLGADALIAARPVANPRVLKTRVTFAGTAVTPQPEQQVTPETPAVATPAPEPTRYSHPARRAGHVTQTFAMGATPRPQTPPSQAVDESANTGPQPAQRSTASGPEPGRPGAAYADSLAVGGTQLLTTGGGGPVGFQAPAGGSASAGGLAPSGVVGGGAIAGDGGPGSAASFGSPGPGGSTGGDVRAAGSSPGPGSPSPGSRSAPQVRPTPKPDPPPPAPEPKPEPEPEPEPEPKPEPSQADLSRFRSMVQSRIIGARRYPSSARDSGQHGTVRVSFRVAPGGQPSGISVASSSGYQSLDAAARRAVSAAGPYRPFPKHMSNSIRVTATVVFRLN